MTGDVVVKTSEAVVITTAYAELVSIWRIRVLFFLCYAKRHIILLWTGRMRAKKIRQFAGA